MRLRILTHNAYWFQGSPSLWGEERPCAHHDVLLSLAQLYDSLAPDVLCLQEVYSTEDAEWLGDRLSMTGCHSPGGRLTDYGGAVLVKDANARVANCTFGDGHANPDFERVCFRTELPWPSGRKLIVVNVHLPSNRFADAQQAARQREKELEQVLRATPRPDVIAGDLNSVPGQEVSRLLTGAGFLDAAVLAGRDGQPTTPGRRRIDYVWIHANHGQALADYEVIDDERISARALGTQFLSDHFPVCVTLALSTCE